MAVQFSVGQSIVVEVRDRKGNILFTEQDAVASATEKWIKSLRTNRYVKAGETTTGGVSFFTPEAYAGLASARNYKEELARIIDEEPRMKWPQLLHAIADLVMEEQSSAPDRDEALADAAA